MNSIISIFLVSVISLILTSSCSYQKMNSVNQKKFSIQEFEVLGDTRDSFLIQKKIQRYSNENSDNKIKLIINLTKNKSIKEKNVQNQVTKYNLSLTADIKIIELSSNKEIKRVISSNQSYKVEESYSATVNNAKETNNTLIDNISGEILDLLRIYYN